MLVTDTCREMRFVFPGLRIMAVSRKFTRDGANDHCGWRPSFPLWWNACRTPPVSGGP
jgi:hypothetical protein